MMHTGQSPSACRRPSYSLSLDYVSTNAACDHDTVASIEPSKGGQMESHAYVMPLCALCA